MLEEEAGVDVLLASSCVLVFCFFSVLPSLQNEKNTIVTRSVLLYRVILVFSCCFVFYYLLLILMSLCRISEKETLLM